MEKQKDEIPKIIIIYELILGFFEFTSGTGILFLGKSLFGIYESLRKSELIEDPNDLFFKLSQKLIPTLFIHRYYLGLLLIGLGTVKIISGIGLVYKKEWAEHLLIIFLVLLIPFDLFGLIQHITFLRIINLSVNIFIVLYLVRFQPLKYYKRIRNFGK